MADLTQLIKGLVEKVNLLERSVHDRQQEPQAPAVTPDRLGHSVYRQALEQGGSLGLQRMRLDELGGGQFGHGVPTPGSFAGVYTPAPVPQPPQPPMPQYQQYRPDPVVVMGPEKVPSAKDAKISLRNFEGNEVYKGLGSGFEQWALLFIEQVEMAEIACGYKWPERFKVNKFGQHLRGKAELFFQQHIMRWWSTQPTLWYVMEQMHMSFRPHISTQQGMRLFGQKKEPSRSWNDHFLYLNALMAATNASPALVLENIVKYAEPDLRHAMMAKVDLNRPDPLQQANELIVWAQMMTDEDKFPKSFGKELASAMAVGTVSESKKDMRKCFKCNEVGHLKSNCPQLNTDSDAATTVEPIAFSLAAGEPSLTVEPGSWILDSGASRHLTNDLTLLKNVVACTDEGSCVMPDGKRMDVLKKGQVTLRAVVDGVARDVVLTDVYYAPKLVQNLISYGRLMARGCALKERGGQLALVKGTDTICYVDLLSNVLVARAGGAVTTPERMGQLLMNVMNEDESAPGVQRDSLMGFHTRLGHLAYDTIELIAKNSDSGIEITDRTRSNCAISAQGKQTRARQPKKDSGEHAPIHQVGAVICSDLKGPMTPLDRLGNRYLVNFVDHKSNYCRVFLAKKKDEAAKKLRDFLVQFEKEFGCSVHILRTDGGGEYRNVDLFCKENGIARQVSEVRNQAANGKAERMHRTVLNMVRCMIFGSGLPLSFWGDAAEYATYILNRSPTRANEGKKSPLEVLTGRQPRLSDIVVFGSKCTAFRDPGKRSMAKRAQTAHVIGRDASTKGFKVYIPSEHKVIVTRHVQNLESLKGGEVDQCTTESVVPAAPDRDSPSPDETTSVETETGPNSPQQAPAVRRSRRKRKKSRRQAEADGDVVAGQPRSLDVLTAAVTGTEVEGASCDSTEPDPKNYHQARKSVDNAQWTAAEQEELRELEENGTWTLVKCPSGSARLHSKWVYKKKRNGAGRIERYKARLVACGNEQVLGVNYHLVCAAVMDMTSAKVIFALAHVWRVPARHGDVPNAYVKAAAEEGVEILLFIPDGMKVSADQLDILGVTSVKELALKLERSLYGLKQAGRLWHLHLHKALIQLGFKQCMTDACIYYKFDTAGITVVGTYVDDLLVTGTDESRVNSFFMDMIILDLKDLGLASTFLGMRVQYSADSGYLFDQEMSIVELLTRFGLEQANSVLAPIGSEEPCPADVLEVLPPLTSKELVVMTPSVANFQSLVGSLLWIARCTRPDIMFAVHCATRRFHAPTMADWKLAKRIARYLSGTRKLKLLMGGGGLRNLPVQAQCYTDADFAGDKDDRKSVSAAIIQLNGMTVGWLCKKQSSVALSTTEAEFVAASVGGQELLGIRELMNELEVGVELPMRMLIDNQAAIVQIESESSSAKAKHVDVRLKFMRDYTAKGIVVPKYVASEAMLADLMTKPLPVPRIRELREAVGLIEDE